MTVKNYIPAWAALFTFAVMALGTIYLTLLFPSLQFPIWLWPILLSSALESAYFAALFLSPRTPILTRVIELSLWLIPLYFLCGGFTNNLLWTSLLTFITWLVARDYGAQLVKMERVADYLGDQGASTVNWEYESLESKTYGSLAIEYFWRRLWFFGVIISVLAIIVQSQNLTLDTRVKLRLALLGGLAVASGLALQGGAYLFRLQILWRHARVHIQPNLTKVWLRNLGVFVLGMVLLLSVAPINYSPVTFERVSHAVSSLFNRPTDFSMPSLPQTETPQFEQGELELPLAEGELGWMGIVLGLSFLLLIALLSTLLLFVLGLLLVTLARGELERLRGLPRLAVQVYYALYRAMGEFIARVRGLKVRFSLPRGGLQRLTDLRGSLTEATKGERRLSPPRGVRAMFRRIARVGDKKGFVFAPAQTPAEYGQVLQKNLAEDQGAIEEFFSGYQKVRYGAESLTKTDEKRLMARGAQIVEQMQSSGREINDG